MGMLNTYLKIIIRTFLKNRFFSFITIFGLALGMACSLLIMLWIADERSIDSFHVNSSRLYNIFEREFADGKTTADYETPGPLGLEMKKNIPEVQYAVSSDWNFHSTFEAGTKIVKKKGCYASADFFRMFSFPLLQGDMATALNGPLSMAISEKMATLFFGSTQAAMGKTMRCDDKKDFTVTAVFDNVPDNASTGFDYVINWKAYYEENPWAEKWYNTGPLTTIMLRPGANAALAEQKIKNFLDKFKKPGPGHRLELGIQRYDERWLHGRFKNGYVSGGRIEYVRIFSIVAIFILLIACINFMNLATARSVKRAKEIGVRKVVGAMRGTLIRQFIGEALLLSLLAVIIALLLVHILLPLFNTVTGKHIALPVSNAVFWLELAALTIITGCVSGSYPAMFLSAFRPATVLKGTMKFGAGALMLRKGLVVFQFTLSIVLIIGTIIVSRQVNYIQTINIGLDRENLIYIPVEGNLIQSYSLFKREAAKLPGIQLVSRMTSSPTIIDNGTSTVDWDGKPADFKPSFVHAAIGYDFTKTAGITLLQGHDFSTVYATDSIGYIINEAAEKKIGYKNAVGSRLTLWGRKGTIIGVVKDFHFASLHDAVNPLILRFSEQENWGNILVRIAPGKTKQVLAGLEQLWKSLNPKFPFTYQFSDEEYNKLYRSETVIGRLSNYFAFLAIFISCLGLLGLAMFTAEQRTREIGIRKVLGAGVGQLFALLSKEFLVLVLIALIIASPVAWWAMNAWLHNYAYRTNISWWIFLAAGSLAVLIALATVSYQALKVAVANPVKSLRKE